MTVEMVRLALIGALVVMAAQFGIEHAASLVAAAAEGAPARGEASAAVAATIPDGNHGDNLHGSPTK